MTEFDLPLPNGDKEIGDAVRKCKCCARELPFYDPNAAIDYLKGHITIKTAELGDSTLVKRNADSKDWIKNDDQALLEATVTGAAIIMAHASDKASMIHGQLKEISEGVRNAEGNLSEYYYFLRRLLETLHRLLVFYFAVERSLHYTAQNFDMVKKGGD